MTTRKPPSVRYATLSYFGVNAFKITNKAGKSAIIRYQFMPEAGEQFLPEEQLKSAGPNYLSAGLLHSNNCVNGTNGGGTNH